MYSAKTEVVVSRFSDRMQEQRKKAAGTLLGWYHSHPGQGGYLTAHDVETHEKFFTDPWQVAILVAAEAGGVTGKFFRSSQTDDWHKTPLPFYELLQPDSIKPDGKKRSFITWRNYKPYGPTLTGPRPKVSTPEPPPPPEAEEPEEVEAEAPEPSKKKETKPAGDRGFRIMRSSADDIPVVKTSADDEPAPPPVPTPPPPPPKSASKTRPAAPVFVPDEPPEPKPPPPPPPPPPPSSAPPPVQKPGDLPWTVTPESVRAVPHHRSRRRPRLRLRLRDARLRTRSGCSTKTRKRSRRPNRAAGSGAVPGSGALRFCCCSPAQGRGAIGTACFAIPACRRPGPGCSTAQTNL